MNCLKVCGLILTTTLMTACSVAVYSPVIGSSLLGLDEEDLSNNPSYAPYIGSPYQLKPSSNTAWFLKRFKSGRYTIEIGTSHEQKERICNLTQSGNRIVISQIYFNKAYGQEFYRSEVTCDGVGYDVPQSMWGEHVMPYLEPI